MNRNLVVQWNAVLLLTLLLLCTLGTPVWATDPTTLELQAPQAAGLGDVVEIVAVLQDENGAPISAASVILWTSASFLSTEGAMKLGQVATDEQGRAVFHYEARTSGSLALNAYFSGDTRYASAQGSAALTVSGSRQIYHEESGVHIPGVGVWLLVALLLFVWSLFFIVMVLLSLIAREGEKANPAEIPL